MRILAKVQFGSRLYGTEIETSDVAGIQTRIDASSLPEKTDPEFANEVIRRAYDEYYFTTLGHTGVFPK